MSTRDEMPQAICSSIIGAADPATKVKVERLVPGAKAMGVTVPTLRHLVADFRRAHAAFSFDEACNLMDSLCQDRCREEILFGIFLIGRYEKEVDNLVWSRLGHWIDALDNWETCDQLASNVSGPLVAAHLAYVDQLIELTRSENGWKRRFGVATASELNHKGRLHAQETFRVCQPLLADPDPMVWRAVGWAIREVSKKDEMAVVTFLRENRQRASTQVLREAATKLSPLNRQLLLV
jgi:3-methyladenine DNA glycosylase AlkD